MVQSVLQGVSAELQPRYRYLVISELLGCLVVGANMESRRDLNVNINININNNNNNNNNYSNQRPLSGRTFLLNPILLQEYNLKPNEALIRQPSVQQTQVQLLEKLVVTTSDSIGVSVLELYDALCTVLDASVDTMTKAAQLGKHVPFIVQQEVALQESITAALGTSHLYTFLI